MADTLSQSERALINAALAAGKRKVIPTGTYTNEVYRWDGRKMAYEGQEIVQPGRPAPVQRKRVSDRPMKPRRYAMRIPEGASDIRRLARQGLAQVEIARELGTTPQRVGDAIRCLGIHDDWMRAVERRKARRERGGHV